MFWLLTKLAWRDELVSIDGYDILRADRTRNVGGVCIYERCHVNYEKRPDLVPNNLEAVCLEIKQANSQFYIVLSIYTGCIKKTEPIFCVKLAMGSVFLYTL